MIYLNGRPVKITGWVREASDVTIQVKASGAYRLVPIADLMADRGQVEIRLAAQVAERHQRRLEEK